MNKIMESKTPLNPHAPCFVPLFRQGKEYAVGPSQTGSEDSDNCDENTLAKPSSTSYREMKQNPLTGLGKAACSFDEPLNSEDWTPVDSDFYDSKMQDEMHLAYLAALFPDISDQSLADVYTANEHDLEASISMLRELELPADFTHPPESYSTTELGTLAEQTTAASGEASGSSSHVVEPAYEGQK